MSYKIFFMQSVHVSNFFFKFSTRVEYLYNFTLICNLQIKDSRYGFYRVLFIILIMTNKVEINVWYFLPLRLYNST